MGGDSEEGGGGSFHWKVSANNAASTTVGQSQNGKQVDHIGSDADGKIDLGEKFTVSIKLPNGVLPEVFLNSRIIENGRVDFILPLEDDKTQVRVSWGENNANNRGKKTSQA